MIPNGNIEGYKELLELIRNPAELNKDTLDSIGRIIRDHPYFQTAQLLYTANLYKEEQHSQFNAQLKKAAAYALDRRKLKELVETVRSYEFPEPVGATPAPIPEKKQEPAPEPPARPVHELPSELRLDTMDEQAEDSVVSEREIESVTDTARPGATLLTKEELIERFIQEEPRISTPRPTFFNPATTAMRSMTDDEEIVTETLAILFYKQGNPTKAIKIYEKLSLLFPEKSSYFAAQIKKISSKE